MKKQSFALALFMMASLHAGAADSKEITIGLIGDSTVAQQSGWGPAFADRFNEHATVLNHAVNGATLESLSRKLDALLALKPDYVLIQFGHNDQKRYDPEVYRDHLKSYLKRIRTAGAKPIVLSSVTRRTFDEHGKIVSPVVKTEKYTFKASLTAYARAAQAVAAETQVPFLDLHTISIAHHNAIGPEASTAYEFKEGDQTHFNKKGGEAIAGLIVPELVKIAPGLVPCLKVVETESPPPSAEARAFARANDVSWQEVFSDPCTGDWKEKWFLDGEVGTVRTGPEGMVLTAGPEYKNDAHHMVLWTKQSFAGDLKIEYDYTRLDDEERCVTILYIQATGSGRGPYAEDIAEWKALRRIPAMKTYFNHMHTYHLSYAAFPNSGEDRASYLRARRYLPEKKGLKGSELAPDYFPEGLFATGVTHHLTVIKHERDLFLRIENPEQVVHCHMANPKLPVITAGRIGLRHMFTRSARYQRIQVSAPKGP